LILLPTLSAIVAMTDRPLMSSSGVFDALDYPLTLTRLCMLDMVCRPSRRRDTAGTSGLSGPSPTGSKDFWTAKSAITGAHPHDTLSAFPPVNTAP
jgi:hypothetical protein